MGGDLKENKVKKYNVDFYYPGYKKENILVTVQEGETIQQAIRSQFNLSHDQFNNIVIYKKKEILEV